MSAPTWDVPETKSAYVVMKSSDGLTLSSHVSSTLLSQVLKDAGMSKEEVDQVVLVGGSTRIPKVGRIRGYGRGRV
jgi:hypothetical protein